MANVATDTYFPTLGGSLLDEKVTETFNPITQIYRDCLFKEEVFNAKNVGFRTKDHNISLVETEKRALCPFDDKRQILSDGIRTLPYGHWRIDAYKSIIKAGTSGNL